MSFFRTLFPKTEKTHVFCSALIAAAGNSTRMGGDNKLLLSLCGIPVLARTLLTIDQTDCIDEIVIASRESDFLAIADLCKTFSIHKPVKIIRGGSTRSESVLHAALEADQRSTLLAVLDGARPLVTPELIEKVVHKAMSCSAAASALPVTDTVKIARDGIVKSTPNRSELYAVQTPQVFDASLLKAALQSAIQDKAIVTDDCSAVERIGKAVYLTDGERENIKITTQFDLILAEAILIKREKQ